MAFFSKKKKEQHPPASATQSVTVGSISSGTAPTMFPVNGASMASGQQQQQQYGNGYNPSASSNSFSQLHATSSNEQSAHQPVYMQPTPSGVAAQQQQPHQQQTGSHPLVVNTNGAMNGSSPVTMQYAAFGPASSTSSSSMAHHPMSPVTGSAQGQGHQLGRSQPGFNGQSSTSNSNLQASTSNASIGGAGNPSLSASASQMQMQQQQQQQGGTGQASSSPVSYPWSQRQIKLQPIQPVSGSQIAAATAQSPVLSPSPFPRYGHSVNPLAQSSNGDLYLFGGLVKEQVRNDLYMVSCAALHPATGLTLSTSSSDSKLLAASPINVSLVETRGEIPCPRVGHASVSVGNVLIVWGGDTKTREEDPQDDNLYLLNLGSRDWTLVKVVGTAPAGRYGHAATMRGSRFYVFGGQQDVPPGAPDEAAFLNDLWCFDLQHLKAGKPRWTKVEYAPNAPIPPKRTGHTMVHHGDSLYVFGGTDGQYHYNDTWCFNTTTSTWSELSCIGYIPVPREGHAATLVDDVVYVFGGRSVDGKDLEDLAAFKISNQRWYMFTNMGPAPSGRSGHAMATWQNKVFVLGGESYMANKPEWPNMIHMLDTGKIKYPSDSKLGNRKTSSSKMNGTPSSSSQGQMAPAPASNLSSIATAPPSSKAMQAVMNSDDPQRRSSASPTGSESSQLGGVKAFQSKAAGGPVNGTGGSPTGNPAQQTFSASGRSTAEGTRKPSDPTKRTMSPIVERSAGTDGSGNRTMSPTQNAVTPPMRSQAVMNGPTSPAAGVNLNALRARSPSPIQSSAQQPMRSIDAYTLSAQQIASSDISRLEQRNKWLQSALAAAVQQGFALPEDGNANEAHADTISDVKVKDNTSLQALLSLKQELVSMKSALAHEATARDQEIANANRGKMVALQEAAFYRAKMAALESSSPPNELNKLEKGRIADLEQRLAEMSAFKSTSDRRIRELEADVERHRDASQTATQREAAHLERAQAAEASYSRSLSDFAELQRRAHGHDSTVHQQLSTIATLESQLSHVINKHDAATSKLVVLQEALDEHERGVEQTQEALAASQAHAAEMESLWRKSQQECQEHVERLNELEAELHRTTQELSDARNQVQDLERALESSQQESTSLRELTSNHLARLVELKTSASRSMDDDEHDLREQQMRSIQSAVDTHKDLAQEAHKRADSLQTELGDVRGQHLTLQKQVDLLQNELASLRKRHAASLESSSRSQALLAQKEMDMLERARQLEASEVKVELLKSLLAENGLAGDERASPSLSSTENLVRSTSKSKLAELDAKLEQRDRAYKELQGLYDEIRHEAESSRHRLQLSEEQVDELQSQVEQLKITSNRALSPTNRGGGEVSSRAVGEGDAEKELAALQEKHQQLEATHLKAVQYVKGTEKMFRRMKDELTKYKERNETLENQLAEAKNGASASSPEPGHARSLSSAELRPELDSLRNQLAELRQHSEDSSAQNEELQQHIRTLKSEYDSTLSRQQSGHTEKIVQFEHQIEELQDALEKAHAELEETLHLNRQLNSELQSALHSSSKSPSMAQKDEGTNAAGAIARAESEGTSWSDAKQKLEQDLSSALNKAEWLKRENAALQERCRESESKVTLLLDHIESSGGVEAVASSTGHSPEQDIDTWKASGRHSDAGSESSSSSLREFAQRHTGFSAQTNGR